jgi:hypothetical protein
MTTGTPGISNLTLGTAVWYIPPWSYPQSPAPREWVPILVGAETEAVGNSSGREGGGERTHSLLCRSVPALKSGTIKPDLPGLYEGVAACIAPEYKVRKRGSIVDSPSKIKGDLANE